MKETDYKQLFNHYAVSDFQSPPQSSTIQKSTQESYAIRNLPIIYESNPNKTTPTKQTGNSRISYSKDEKVISPNGYHATSEGYQGLSYANTTSHVVESTSYQTYRSNSPNVNVYPPSSNKDMTEIPRVQANKPASRVIIDRNVTNYEAPRSTTIDLSTLGYGTTPTNLSTLGYGSTSHQVSSLGSGLPEPSSQIILPKVPVITQPSGSQIYIPQAPVTSLPSGSQIYRTMNQNPIGMQIGQNESKMVVGGVSHMSTQTVPRVNYERCVTECKNWQTKYNELYLKYMNIATSMNVHSNDELQILREQNYNLKNNLRQLEDKKNKMINLLENRFS